MLPEILGPHMAELKALVPTLARESGPLVILGEQGVGKSFLACHVHAATAGPDAILHAVNLLHCTERDGRLALLGSDFAKLTSTKRSLLERGGNVLIAHINAAALSLQDEIAAAFRTRSFVRPGSIRKANVACRPIFTLRQSPQAYLENGSLSLPLFQLLSSIRTVTIPPLRERPGDIVAIARDMLGRDLTEDLQKILLADPWPRNVLELKVYLLLLRPFTGRSGPLESCLHQVRAILQRIEEGRGVSLRESILSIESMNASYALHCAGGHKTRAAELLGVTRTSFRRRIDNTRRPS